MAALLSLPEELITQIYILAGQNTRALVRLSAVNRRLRAIWLRDSDHIIAQSLELKAPGHQDAIALTVLEACCPMPTSGFHHIDASPDDRSLRLHLPGLMRNVGVASKVPPCAVSTSCQIETSDSYNMSRLSASLPNVSVDHDSNKLEASGDHFPLRLQLPQLMRNVGVAITTCSGTVKWHNRIHKDDLLSLRPLPSAYYLTRQFLVAYHYPELRRPLCDFLKAQTNSVISDCERITWYLHSRAPGRLRLANRLYDYDADRIPYDEDLPYDGPTPKPMVAIAAAWLFQMDVVGKLEDDRDAGVEGEPDDEYHPFGGEIEPKQQ